MSNFSWKFIDGDATFVVNDADKFSRLYFPLANEAEFMSAITPNLKGDIKTGQNTFLLEPVSTIDLYSKRGGRDFWVYIDKNKIWSLNGSAIFGKNNEVTALEAGLLWHKIIRENRKLGLRAEVLNFVPSSGEHVEIMQIAITNISKRPIKFNATSAIPIYARSADNLRDHRHVTSLLNRTSLDKHGIIVKPTMTFDERGHKINHISYYCLGIDAFGNQPKAFFPTLEDFIGEAGNLEYPKAILENLPGETKIMPHDQGRECLGGLRFQTQALRPNQSIQYIILLGIAEHPEQIKQTLQKFNSPQKINHSLSQTKSSWQKRADKISFSTDNSTLDNWLSWVNIQPELRKIYGCSFLPDFDYGRGGKGWRDLWQDCLALLLNGAEDLRHTLAVNFSGIRIDGSNATIITKHPGYFIADRNKISRVWMDHGIWPYFTLELYINQTGDFNILFEKTTYFRDMQLSRGREIDRSWNETSKHLHTKNNKIYKGTLLEHILVQHLVQFFNVGEHGNIRLEGADWNDGLDMAKHRGESVAFTAFYARNLKSLALLLEKLPQKEIKLFKELALLLGTKNKLDKYFKAVKYNISGKTITIPKDKLIKDLNQKAQHLSKNIRKNEWLGEGFFNSYYDDNARRVEGKQKSGMRMTLTGQVFPILSGTATDAQARKVFLAAKKYLQDKASGGFRLNTDFKETKMDLGRAFAFAYGEKENGAFFSHMNIMFAYALYSRGFVKEGFEVLNSIYKMSMDLSRSRIYPGLPEYFDAEGRGKYMYLTGSASWYIFTLLTQVFGVRGEEGNLLLSPKLVTQQFKNKNEISVSTHFAGKKIKVTYFNPNKISYPSYKIKKVTTSPSLAYSIRDGREIIISRHDIEAQSAPTLNLNIALLP